MCFYRIVSLDDMFPNILASFEANIVACHQSKLREIGKYLEVNKLNNDVPRCKKYEIPPNKEIQGLDEFSKDLRVQSKARACQCGAFISVQTV